MFITQKLNSVTSKGHTVRLTQCNMTDAEEYQESFFLDEASGKREVHSLDLSGCYTCGEFLTFSIDDDDVITVDNEACVASKVEPVVVRIEVPSGKLVCSDSLYDMHSRNVQPVNSVHSYNTYAGQRETIELEMTVNSIAYGPTGNSCPSVYQNPANGNLVVLNFPVDEELFDRTGEYKLIVPEEYQRYVHVGSIDTNLWAYSFMDYDAFMATEPSATMMESVDIIDVSAGTWEFTNYSCQPYPFFDYDGWNDVIVYGEGSQVE